MNYRHEQHRCRPGTLLNTLPFARQSTATKMIRPKRHSAKAAKPCSGIPFSAGCRLLHRASSRTAARPLGRSACSLPQAASALRPSPGSSCRVTCSVPRPTCLSWPLRRPTLSAGRRPILLHFVTHRAPVLATAAAAQDGCAENTPDG